LKNLRGNSRAAFGRALRHPLVDALECWVDRGAANNRTRCLPEMVLIIGGGISGLSVAWFLHRKGVVVRVLEFADRVGGAIATDHIGTYLVERGPNSTLQKPGRDDDALGRLVAQTDLGERLVEAGAAGNRRFVMRAGRLQLVPGSPPGFLTTGLFSWRAKLRLLREPFVGKGEGEETIARFVERRLGREFLDYAVEPFISGVYAGDPGRLSIQAAVPRIYALERRFGSLILGAIALGKVAKGTGTPTGRLISFDRGMAQLPGAIVAKLPPGACRTGCRAVRLQPSGRGWEVGWESASESGVCQAERVVLAVPAAESADLLEPLSREAACLLRTIPYAPIVSACLAYDRSQVRHPLDGVGFLAPRREGVQILGGLFSNSLFAGRAPDGKVLITAFIGGSTNTGVVALGDDELIPQIQKELARVLDITGEPSLVRLARHRRAIPQYTLGHLARIAKLDLALAAFPGLHLRGSWRDGISVADCIKNGELLAERLA
jgi:oxygen-dependent protoporphyrinogen oxidase